MKATHPWTKAELTEFDRLIDKCSSRNQVMRIAGRFDMDKFVAMHGEEKCDAMWQFLEGKNEEKI